MALVKNVNILKLSEYLPLVKQQLNERLQDVTGEVLTGNLYENINNELFNLYLVNCIKSSTNKAVLFIRGYSAFNDNFLILCIYVYYEMLKSCAFFSNDTY